jgi:hypothetical protein
VARYHIDVQPQRASIFVDGKEIAQGNVHEVLVNSGEREIIVEAEGFEALRRTIRAEPGEQRELKLVLSPIVEEPEEQEEPALVAPPRQDRMAEAPAKPKRTWVWVSAASAVAFAGLGAAFYVLAGNEYDDIKSACGGGRCPAAESSKLVEQSPGQAFDALAVTSFVLSGVAAATAITLYVVGNRAQDKNSVALSVGPSQLRLAGSF